MSNDRELIQFEPGTVLDPVANAQHNQAAANACREIVLRTAQAIQGHRYIRVEGWQAIANALGFFVGAGEVRREVDAQGTVTGWTAAGYVRDREGRTIATGEGYVGRDEKRWSTAAEYACRAMAQTRAQSRAARGAFAFIAVMVDANLKTTPAEEVPDGGFEDPAPPKPDLPASLRVQALAAVGRMKWGKSQVYKFSHELLGNDIPVTELDSADAEKLYRAILAAEKDGDK